MDGDICEKDLGLDEITITKLQRCVNIVIHAASSINLRHKLARIAPIIVQGTLNVASLALSCTNLQQFVYVSTAYSNSYLHYLDPWSVPHISENIHPLRDYAGLESDTDSEWDLLQKYGTTPEFENTPFPWAYAYAKHLTERLLMDLFKPADKSKTSSWADCEDKRLLIVRPSIIGPSESFPEPGWQVATSAPVTGLLAYLIITPARRLTFYSQFDKPNQQALIDEVPVDIVVNRIVMHAHLSTSGIVHANRDISSCYRFSDYANAAQRLRRLPWNTKFVWDRDSNSPKVCEIAKLYAVAGCTFDFASQKSADLWSEMQIREKNMFPLFASIKLGMSNELDLSLRGAAFEQLLSKHFKRQKWPSWLLPVFYRTK